MRPIRSKILPRAAVAEAARSARAAGRIVGFTSGAFDLLHAGHADYLEQARSHCDLLVVAVNTDASIRAYKGPNRPIVPQEQRAELVAALEAVDLVFLFEERRNAQNIEAVRPDLYIKAGDYSPAALTSAPLVERYGGKTLLIPVRTPTSTTDLVRRAAASVGASPDPGVADAAADSTAPVCIELPRAKLAPAVFLDRDGVINREVGHLHDPADFELLPNAPEGMAQFMAMGYRLVVVTNQGGIGLGYFTRGDFYRVNSAMFRALQPWKIVIDRVYFCPHGPSEPCGCRKPGTDLLLRARDELNIDLARSLFIGDRTTDLETARRAGIPAILLRTGAAGQDGAFDTEADYVADDLLDAARWVLDRERGGEIRPAP